MTTASEPMTSSSSAAHSLAERISLRASVAAVSGLGAAALWVPPTWDASASVWLPALGALTVLSILLEFVIVRLPAGGRVSLATAPQVATILLVPAPFAAISISMAVLIRETARGSTSATMLYTVAGAAVTASVASFVMGLLGSVWRAAALGDTTVLLPLSVLTVAAYLGTHTLLASVRTSLAGGGPVPAIVRRRARAGLPELATAATGALLAGMWLVHPLLLLVLATPVAVVVRSLRHARRSGAAAPRSALRYLAEVVDGRDATTEGHSVRVAAEAARLARALALPEPEIRIIEQAASVHDVGKACVPDAVLLKPARLTGSETQAVRRHSGVGAEIAARFGLRSAAGIVRHHHERWDGGGYPDRLAGDAIPIGARIVAVADAYDAMTSARPYRRALSRREAVRRLAGGAGTQWDPRVVDAYLALVARDGDEQRIGDRAEKRERRSASRPLMGRQPVAGRPAARERGSGAARKAS